MIIYDTFFRRTGVRLPQHLLAPNLPSLENFSFPKNSIHHFTTMDNIVTGPSTHEHLYRDIEKKIFVYHVLDTTGDKGDPRKVAIPLEPLVREFHIRHKRFRRAIKLENLPRDENTLAVINYALLTKSYRYMKSLYAEYNRWWNLNKTIWDSANTVAKSSDRHQFIFLELPKVLPSVARLNNFLDKVNPNFINYFRDTNALMLLEFWKWLDPDTRKDSIMAGVDPTEMSKINIIYQESGRMLVMNMGLLNSWIQRKNARPDEPNGKLSPDKIRKCFLRMLMALMEYRTVDASIDPDMGKDDIANIDGEPTVVEGENGDTFVIKNDNVTVQTATSADQQVTDETPETFEDRFKDLEKDLEQLAIIEKEQDIENSLEKNDVEDQTIVNTLTNQPINLKDFDIEKSPDQVLKDTCDKLADDGLMSAAEYRKYVAQIDKMPSLPSPIGSGSVTEFIKIKPEDIIIKEPLKFKDRYSVVDKSMLESSLEIFDKNYISKVLPKDIVSMSVALQRAGFVISKYDIEPHEDILGAAETHVIRINPIVGKPSTLRIKLPKIQNNGEFMVGGTKYRMRKQRGDVPIRKIAPNRVALTSYYGKTFVNRSEKRVADYSTWIQTKINLAVMDGDTNIVNAYPANVFNHEVITPRAYSSISMAYRRIDVSGFELYFDLVERTKTFTPEIIKKFETKGSIILGKHRDGRIAILDTNNMVNVALPSGDPSLIGSIEEFLGFENKVPPVEMAEARVFGMNIPVGLVLGYLYGLDKLLALLKVTPRRVNTGTRVNLQDFEYGISFSDETLVFNRDDELAKLVMGGFLDYEKVIRSYSVYQFDKRAVYLNVLESKKITTRYLREIDLLDKLFVDPITESILKEMQEPTTYRGLIMRSCELLLTDAHPRSLDLNFQRIKGYERVAGAVYSEMINSIRDHRGKLGRSSASIDLKPFAVWKKVVGDPAVKITEDINPINSLKEVEAVTFSGVGGRNSRSLTRSSREYDPNDIGVISESTVDSSDVAINVYTSANPNFSSVRGLTNRVTPEAIKSTQLFSTSALLATGSDTDDPKRVNFVGVQNSHTIATVASKPVTVRTGYEQIVGNRVGEGYVSTAKQDGVVVSVTDDGIIVKYKDGTTEGFETGRRFGHAGGLTIPHTMVSTMKVGDKFTAEDVIVFNSDWFEQDIVNPRNVIMKYATIARVALAETKQTHEDASSITRELSERLGTKTTKVKKISVGFNQSIKNLVKEHTQVNFDTVLCSIEDEVTANNDMFDANTIETLAMLSNQTPTAKMEGVVERIEVYYNGSKDDMSTSLREIVNDSDRKLAKRLKAKNGTVFTGEVDESYRVDGEPLMLDNLVICIYMTTVVGAGVGDKGVFANQMKTVFSEIIDYDLLTESGLKLDGWFGAISIFKRIVNSPLTIGTTNVLLRLAGESAYKAYKGK